MEITFAHYRNRFCMFRTYYAIAAGIVKPDGVAMSVIEVPDPPSRAQEEALIKGDVQVANLYLPNFLRCKIDGAPIVGLSTEWKSTVKGNGMFVRAGGPVKTPKDLTGRLIATHHKTPHVVHRYLLKHRYNVDERSLRWESHPQEELLDILKSGKADAVVLIDQFFFRGEQDETVRCLYTDGAAWNALTDFPEMIKHMVAIREPLWRDHPELREKLLTAFKASIAYSERHLPEIAEKFMARYGGERDAILASARYPKIEFTFTDAERKIAEAEMKMLAEMGELPREIPIAPLFVI
ncbi:MAG TPA: MqnA/MqnD/SBP family protein [Candidatus Binatia bacterium]|jgi:ABC-type nitrate/sulfonate/bicarbonate transport system substrate-binding protein